MCGERERTTLVVRQRYEMPSRGAVHGGYDVVVCDRCGFGFAQDPPSQDYLDYYYNGLAKKTEMIDPSTFEETQETIERNQNSLRNIVPFVKPGDRVLEIGCYTGYLLALIAKETPNVTCVGIESSGFAASVAKTRNNLDVRVGSVFDDLDIGTFDVVIVLHVLEHIVDAQRFVSKVKDFLRPGGKLHFEVPDAANFILSSSSGDMNLARSEPYLEFNFEHINYFTLTSLRNLMEGSGYKAITIQAQQSTVPVISSTWSLRPLPFAVETYDALRAYADKCSENVRPAESALRKLEREKREFIVWGAGPHTQRLIGSKILDMKFVIFFVDSNPDFAGGTLSGRSIHNPAELTNHPGVPILVSSFRFEREIADKIREAGYPNEIITMYP